MIDLKRFRKDFKIPQRENYELLDIEQLYLSAIENVTGKATASEQHHSSRLHLDR